MEPALEGKNRGHLPPNKAKETLTLHQVESVEAEKQKGKKFS